MQHSVLTGPRETSAAKTFRSRRERASMLHLPVAEWTESTCGFVYSKISDPFRDFGELLGGSPLGSEKAFGVNYSLQVTPYFPLQPTVQYYVHVGGNPTLSNAPVLGSGLKSRSKHGGRCEG